MPIKLKERITPAQSNFGTAGTLNNGAGANHFNIPKAKYNFLVNFELTSSALLMIREMYGTDIPLGQLTSFVIKDIDKPSFAMATNEVNQYNRTRLVPGKITYDPISVVMYDTVNSAALMLIDAYRRYYYGDFSDKTLASWRYDTISSSTNFEEPTNNTFESRTPNYGWGRSVFNMGDRDDGYFFKRIDIYEIDGSIYTVHNIHNPVLTTVKFDNKTHESEGEPSTISLSIQHEGSTNICPFTGKKAIAASSAELANALLLTNNISAMGFYKAFGEMDTELSNQPDPNIAKNYPMLGATPGTDFINNTINSAFGIVTSNITSAVQYGTNAAISAGTAAIKNIGGLF